HHQRRTSLIGRGTNERVSTTTLARPTNNARSSGPQPEPQNRSSTSTGTSTDHCNHACILAHWNLDRPLHSRPLHSPPLDTRPLQPQAQTTETRGKKDIL